MNVHIGAPSAEDLEDRDFIWVSVGGKWVLCRFCDSACVNSRDKLTSMKVRLWSIDKYLMLCPIRIAEIKKWAHCEGPVESANV